MGDTIHSRMHGTRASPARTGLIAALDVGSSKVACIIGRAESGGLRVLGAALHESRGIRAGSVTALELAEESIREAVDAAERHADHRIQDVIISVQCGQPKSLVARAEHEIGGALVNDAHLRDLLSEGKRACREEGYETIQASPISYAVDQSRGVRDPRGMFCDRLGVNVHAVAVKAGPLQNLRLAVENCHLSVTRQIFAPYASGLAVLTADELSLGSILLDMGAGVTSIAVFLDDALVHVDAVPLGGASVTSDIARVLSTPLSAAERMKSLYGSAFGEIEAGADLIDAPLMGEELGDDCRRVRRSHLTKIIQSRMEEILAGVDERLRRSGFDVAVGRRMVLTGGGCQLAGTRELAARMLNKQVRIARPQTFPGLAAAVAGPAYATVVGLLIAGANTAPEELAPEAETEMRSPRRGLARLFGGQWFG
jgi:cell division protein FtsA